MRVKTEWREVCREPGACAGTALTDVGRADYACATNARAQRHVAEGAGWLEQLVRECRTCVVLSRQGCSVMMTAKIFFSFFRLPAESSRIVHTDVRQTLKTPVTIAMLPGFWGCPLGLG